LTPNNAKIGFIKIKPTATKIILNKITAIIAFPTLLLLVFSSFAPSELLNNVAQPSPINWAIANATTVNGNTKVVAIIPAVPAVLFPINIWSTIL